METGKIQYQYRCPECQYLFETGDPQAVVPTHKAAGSTGTCPGSKKMGINISKRIHPKTG